MKISIEEETALVHDSLTLRSWSIKYLAKRLFEGVSTKVRCRVEVSVHDIAVLGLRLSNSTQGMEHMQTQAQED